MTVLSSRQIQLTEQLLLTVKNKENTISYSELASRIGLPGIRRAMGNDLLEISTLCHELGLPLLSAKVVRKTTVTPGNGFFTLYKTFGMPAEGKSESQLWKAELKAIRECAEWYRLEDYLPITVGMPRPTDAV